MNLEVVKKLSLTYLKVLWKTKIFFVFLFCFIISILNVIEPFIFAWIIKKIEVFMESWFYSYSEFLLYIFFWFLFILFTTLILYIYRYYLVDVFILKVYKESFLNYSKKLFDMSYWDYLDKKSWSVYKNFDKWIDAHFRILFDFFNQFLRNLLSVLVIVIVLFFVNWKMTLVSLSLLPVLIWLWIFFNKKTNPNQKKVSDRWDKIFGITWDALNNFMLFKLLNLENTFINKISNNLNHVFADQLKVSKQWSISDIYVSIIIMISRMLVLGFWFYMFINGEIQFYILFLFFSFIGYIYFPVWFIFSLLRWLQENIVYISKFYQQFEKMNYDTDIKVNKNIKTDFSSISFTDVDFSYIKWKNILKNLSFDIKKGEKIAFVWNTWSWKSTITNLILRFWDINSGEINIWWINISDLDKKTIREQIWVVSQDNSLFNASIKENLLFSKPKATKLELEKALKNAKADFVFDLDKWIDTMIGERWLKLSWWEKQRISIARLFLKDPKIIILDEATSALDNKTEKLIQKSLDTLMKWRTSIVIAHRLTTIQNSDRIFVLEKWKIVENWSYVELVNKKWKFYELSNPSHLIIN